MKVLSVTINPVLDKSTQANLIQTGKKIRCEKPRYEPGGGGINVSRAMKYLCCDSTACFLTGGNTGKRLTQLLEQEKIQCLPVESATETRENLMVLDKTTGEQYRFGMPGPEIPEKEWQAVINVIKKNLDGYDYLVASGSLPPGVPDDFYARLARITNQKNIRMVLDTSGDPLKIALEQEGVHMIKPNLGELARLLDKKTLSGMEQEVAAEEILGKEQCEILVLSLGARGAMIAMTNLEHEYIIPPTVPVISAVGAGDSMVAGILTGIKKGMHPNQAVRYGVAAGTAATMTPGSALCTKEDTDRIFEWMAPD
ncbi:MAG: 1-phosphofructokinase family hexose kinase [Bacteroidota bacterium]